jgi:hypothetical protein
VLTVDCFFANCQLLTANCYLPLLFALTRQFTGKKRNRANWLPFIRAAGRNTFAF